MKKSIVLALVSLLAAGSLYAAHEVKNESELKNAISEGKTDILLTGSFTTSGDITIPAGCTVTLGNGVELKVYYKDGGKNGTDTIHCLKGEGTIVTSSRTVTTVETRSLPTIGGSHNPFSGMTYEVTKVESTGGSIKVGGDYSTQVQCNVASVVSVDGGKTQKTVNVDAKAVVCKASSGINGGRTFVGAYSSMEAAYNAAKYGSSNSMTHLPPDKEFVVLLADGEVNLPKDNPNVGVIVDCAGYKGSFPKPSTSTVQFNSYSAVTLLNASSATVPQLTQSSASFINCASANVSAVNANQDTYNTQVHIYDCGSVSLKTKYPAAGGAYFHCGGPYSMSFGTNYKVYGGIFTKDPTSYLASTDLEAVKGSDGNWVVQEKKKTVNVAFIGSAGYESLQDAVDAAAAGAKIELVSDIELESPVVVAADKNITVELAGMDIVSESGAFINNGTLKLEDSSNYDEPSRLTTAAGNLIENNGSLEITYGDYSGAILLNGGTFTVHGGTFNGTLVAGADVVSPKSVANIRGGKFKNSVAAFLAEGYLEPKHHDGYCYVGKFPYSIVTEKAISGTEKGWTLKGLSDEDRAIYSKTSNQRADYSDADWYRRAELISMLTPYSGYTIDCVVSFDRATAKESVQIYLQTVMSITEKLDKDLQANEIYRILSSKIEEGNSQISYERFLKEDAYKSIAVGVKNLSEENDGTVCTIEFHLCKPDTHNKTELVTVYVLASESYQFPVKTVEITLPKIENATWWYNGEEVAGSIVVDKGTNVELTLKAADGYQFAGGATSKTVALNSVNDNVTAGNAAFAGVAAPDFTVAKIGNVGYTSLAEAVSAANPGDTVELAAGEIVFDTQIILNKSITFKGASVTKARSVSAGGTILKFDTAASAFVITSSDVTFKDMTIEQGTQDNSSHISISKGAWDAPEIQYSNILIENVNFVGGDNALFLIGENVVVRNCTFTDQDSHNIIIYSLKGESAIVGNTFNASKGSNKSAILWEGGADNATDLSGFIGGGSLVIEGNAAYNKGVFFQFTNWGLVKDASVKIVGNTIDAFTNKAIALYDMDGAVTANGDEFGAFEVKDNVFTNVPAGRPILKEYTGTVEVEASENHLGSESPDIGVLLVGDKVVVNSYYADPELEVLVLLGLVGAGTEADPFLIKSLDDLVLFRDSVNAGETKYNAPGVWVALAVDIDLATVDNWEPIGNWDYSFDANFDGNGHKIQNLKMSDTVAANGESYLGFFGITANNAIKDLVIENVTISSSGQIVAAAIAYPYYTTVDNITVCGNIAIKGGNYTAGVLAYTRLCQKASNLTVAGNEGSYITGAQAVGGIMADIQMNKGLIADYANFSVSGVTITGTKMVGGIAGIIATQTLEGASVKNVTLVCEDSRVGIVAGSFGGTCTISGIVAENVTGATAVIGAAYDGAAAVQARIGDTFYATFAEALNAAKGGESVTLLANVGDVVLGKSIALDLNGCTIGEITLAGAGVTLTAPAGLDVVTSSEGCGVVYADGVYSLQSLPDAEVTNLGSITVGLGDYTAEMYKTYDLIGGSGLQSAEVPYDLTLAMDFKAKDTSEAAAQNAFGNYTTDFFITMSGMSGESFVGKGCYLAGYYPSFNAWVKIPLDGFTVENGKVYPVITSAGFDFKYTDICGTVGQFICGIYLTPAVLEANPDLKVDLTLGLAENKDAALNAEFFKVDNYIYDADDLQPVTLPEVVITDIKNTLTDADPDLTFALNFAIKDVGNLSEEYLEKLFAKYGDYYTDYVLTISGLTDPNGSVKFNANGNGDGYLAGQYDAWSKSWVTVPFSDVTIKNGQSFYIMEYAAELMGKGGLRFTLKEIAEIVQNFDCGVYFTPEFLAANPNLKVDLELKVFTEDENGNKVGDISVATNTFDKDDFSVEAAKLDIRIVNGKPQIGFAGEGKLVLNAATALTGEWTKNVEYTAVENDGDDTKTWVTPKDGYYFFKGYIVR